MCGEGPSGSMAGVTVCPFLTMRDGTKGGGEELSDLVGAWVVSDVGGPGWVGGAEVGWRDIRGWWLQS